MSRVERVKKRQEEGKEVLRLVLGMLFIGYVIIFLLQLLNSFQTDKLSL